MLIKKNYIIEKRNILNEIRSNNMTLQELRFFSIYLAKINSRDISTRIVRFPLVEFQRIMEFGKLNIAQLSATTDSLLCKVVKIPRESGGYNSFQLFKECTIDTDENGEWYIEIDAHDKSLPLMFEFKDKYFKYKLWNALSLRSSNQLRMYELLKQYEKISERIISVDELKELLGIDKKEYTLFNNFKVHVLDVCQQALAENTDIKFTYEPTGKKGKGGKILFLKFTVKSNADYTDRITLDRFLEQKPSKQDEEESEVNARFHNRMEFLSEACDNEFSENEMSVLHNSMVECLPYDIIHDDLKCYEYLMHKYHELKMRSEKTKITYRFSYLKKLIESDFCDVDNFC